jgi:hypothetical protein
MESKKQWKKGRERKIDNTFFFILIFDVSGCE